jgi:hypothetical protein
MKKNLTIGLSALALAFIAGSSQAAVSFDDVVTTFTGDSAGYVAPGLSIFSIIFGLRLAIKVFKIIGTKG